MNYNIIVRSLHFKLKKLIEYISSENSIEDISDYKKILGEIKGINFAISEVEDILKKNDNLWENYLNLVRKIKSEEIVE